MDDLRKEEKRQFFQKITVYIARVLIFMKKVDKWEYAEIAERTGLRQNRLTEIVNHENYNKLGVNERNLILLLGGGIVSIKELKEKVQLNKREQEYLDTFAIYEDRELRMEVAKVKKLGHNPTKILKDWRLKNAN